MQKHIIEVINHNKEVLFDYTEFLAVSCQKQWRFVDAVLGVFPLFSTLFPLSNSISAFNNELLKKRILQVLSTHVSDETNIIRLIALVRRYGIQNLTILLPYALENEQLDIITCECGQSIFLKQVGEHLSIQMMV